MATHIVLNGTTIPLEAYEETLIDGHYELSLAFKVSSEDYHQITTLLYEGVFDVSVPESHLTLRAKIEQYATSITNLYEAGQVGDFKLVLRQIKTDDHG